MSLSDPIPLGDVHSELSCILYAVQEGLKDFGVTVEVTYNRYTYLGVTIDVWPARTKKENQKKLDGIVARLHHGILWGEYDYRFRGISHPCRDHLADWEGFSISATLDMQHWPHRKPHGWEVVPTTREWHERFERKPSWFGGGGAQAVG